MANSALLIGTGGGTAPTGTVVCFAGSSAPSGWLLCDGSAVSQTTYAALYSVIGTTYGAPGGGNFSLPDLRANVPVGRKSGDTDFGTLGGTGGAKTHTLTMGQLPDVSGGSPGKGFPYNYANLTTASHYQPTGTGAPGNTAAGYITGSGQAHNNLQPYLVLNYIIKH